MEGDHQKSLAKLMAQYSNQEEQQTFSATLPTNSTDSELVPVNNPESASDHDENNVISHNCPDEFPPGYRFCPLDGELIVHYLMNKIEKERLPHDKIKEVNLYQFNPDELSANYEVLGEKEWYFFTPRDRKYPNGSRPNRAAGDGYWKATGADKPVKYKGGHVGYRKALVFYRGKPAKSHKTNWIMHEFRANHPPRNKTNPKDMRLDDWVLCRIYNKVENGKIQVRNEVPKRVSCPPTQNKNEKHFAGRNYEYNGIQDSSGQHISSSEGFHASGFSNVLPQAPHPMDTSFMSLQKFNGNFHQPLPYGGGSLRPINSIPPVFPEGNAFRPNYFEEDMSNIKTGGFQETIWDSSNLDIFSLLDAANLIDPYLNLDNIASDEPAPDDYIASQTDPDNLLDDSSIPGTN